MSDSAEEDLRDVFRLLYHDEAWDISDDEENAVTLPETVTDVEIVERDIAPVDTIELYTRKRFRAELDSLFSSSPSKKRRIYNHPPYTPSIYPSIIPSPPLPSTTTYAPFSPLAYLSRLRTYNPSTFTSHLDPIKFALHGWIVAGRDTLSCEDDIWDVRGLDEIQDERVRREVCKRIEGSIGERHKRGSAWRVRSSPEVLHEQLRTMLHPMLSSSLASLAQRLEEECMQGGDVRWSSPLTFAQLDNLSRVLSSTLIEADSPSNDPEKPSSQISDLSAALSLFAWYPYHPNSPSSHHISVVDPTKRTEIVSCRICQRRIGLWTFRNHHPDRCFDLQNEHLGWCPIRTHVGAETKAWWEDLDMLKDREKVGMRIGLSQGVRVKGLIGVSPRLEKKAWRRG